MINRLHGIQRLLAQGSNPFPEDLWSKLWVEYEITLFDEKYLWAQKSRCDWIVMGNRNAKFFHLSTIVQRIRNRILAFKYSSNAWVHHPNL